MEAAGTSGINTEENASAFALATSVKCGALIKADRSRCVAVRLERRDSYQRRVAQLQEPNQAANPTTGWEFLFQFI